MNAMRWGVLCSLSLLVGCEAIDSEDLLTSGMYAELTATTRELGLIQPLQLAGASLFGHSASSFDPCAA